MALSVDTQRLVFIPLTFLASKEGLLAYFSLEQVGHREILTVMTKLLKCIILSSNLRLCKTGPMKDLDPSILSKIVLKLCSRAVELDFPAWGCTLINRLEADPALHIELRWEGG